VCVVCALGAVPIDVVLFVVFVLASWALLGLPWRCVCTVSAVCALCVICGFVLFVVLLALLALLLRLLDMAVPRGCFC